MNMPYCRFQNTLRDLGDCFANLATLNPEDQSFNECEERECRRELILTCARILQEIGVEDPYDEREVLACVEKLDEMFAPEAEEKPPGKPYGAARPLFLGRRPFILASSAPGKPPPPRRSVPGLRHLTLSLRRPRASRPVLARPGPMPDRRPHFSGRAHLSA